MTAALRAQAVNTPGASTTHTVNITLVAGDHVVVCVALRTDAVINSVVGSTNGAFTQAGSPQTDTTTRSAIYYFENAAGGAETITVTTAASVVAYVNVSAWTGIRTSGSLDQNNGANNASGTSHSHGSITTTGPSAIITVSAQSGVATETVSSGFTALTNIGARDYFQYKISGSSETTSATYTTDVSVATTGKIANFLEPDSGATITPDAGSLAMTGAAPTVSVSGNVSITPAAAALAILGAAVTQTLTVPSPSAGALTFEGAAPTVSQTTGATIQPNAGAITLAGASPTVTNTTPGIVIAPASGSLSLAGSAPTVALNNMDIVPTAGALTLAGAAPNVSVTGSSSGGQARNRRRRGMLNMIWGR